MDRSGPATAAPSGANFAHLRPLDGLRGVAVAAVVVYHLFPDVLSGGFLGVDLFFVLSGFLIASLVVGEHQATGGVGLRNFWVRRLRRLMPAVLVMLVALVAFTSAFGTPAELARLRTHGLWSLGWMANWRFVLDGTTYTDVVVGASPLRHMWSLAIEEQFYLLFPLLVLVLGAAWLGGGGNLRRRLVAVAGAGAVASAVWMVVVFHSTGGIERAYFGTDTRVQGLLVGVVLGAVLVGRPPATGQAASVLRWLAFPAVAVVGVLMVVAGEQAAWMYHGGFFVVAMAAAVVIAAVRASGWLAASLSWRPLVALGLISYGVYLWHWPVIVLVNRQLVGFGGVGLAAVQVVVTLAIAVVSWRFVEQPVRHGVLRQRLGRWAVVATPVGVATAAVVLVAGTTVPELPTVEPRAAGVVASATTGPGALVPAVAGKVASLQSGSADAAVLVPQVRGPLPIVVMGDSVAHTLAGGSLNAGSDDHPPWAPELSHFDPALATMVSIARPRCSYIPGRMVIRTGGRIAELDSDDACGDWKADLREALDATDSRVVVLVAANDTLGRNVDGAYLEVGTPEWSALYTRHLNGLARMVDRAGAHLVMVTPPPRSGRFFVEPDNESGWREAAVTAAMEAHAAGDDRVSVVDMAAVVCPDGDCDNPTAGFDPAWRNDGLHYDSFGARWFADWITPQLEDLDPGTSRR